MDLFVLVAIKRAFVVVVRRAPVSGEPGEPAVTVANCLSKDRPPPPHLLSQHHRMERSHHFRPPA